MAYKTINDLVRDNRRREPVREKGFVDLKRSKKDAKKSMEPIGVPYTEDYPYGLSLDLDDEVMKKLQLEMPKVGDTFTITAKVRVKSANMHDDHGGKRSSCCLQLTKLKVV